MRVSVIPPGDLGKVELARWRAIQQADPAFDSPFLSPEFTIAVGDLQDRVRVAVLHDGPDVVGFLPFERHPMGIGMPVAAGLTDAQGLVHAKDLEIDPHQLIKACDLAVFEFDHLIPGQPLLPPGRIPCSVTDHRSPGRLRVVHRDDQAEIRQDLPFDGLQDPQAPARRGPIHHDYATTDLAPLHTLLGWKTDQYRRTGRTDRFARPWIVELVERLLATDTEHFAGVLDMLYVDGRPVAGHFGAAHQDHARRLVPRLRHRLAKYSPGLIHHLAMAEEAAAAGSRSSTWAAARRSTRRSSRTASTRSSRAGSLRPAGARHALDDPGAGPRRRGRPCPNPLLHPPRIGR